MVQKKVLMTPDGKRVVIDTGKDEKLYSAPVNPPNTGTTYTRGTDLYRHVARSGTEYFYFYGWSMWQGSEDEYTLADRSEVESFLLEKAGLGGWGALDENEIARLAELGFDIYEENA